MDQDLVRRYLSFRGRTGRVGRDAACALWLARAEQRAEREGFHVRKEPEDESYADVYGEEPPPGVPPPAAQIHEVARAPEGAYVIRAEEKTLPGLSQWLEQHPGARATLERKDKGR